MAANQCVAADLATGESFCCVLEGSTFCSTQSIGTL